MRTAVIIAVVIFVWYCFCRKCHMVGGYGRRRGTPEENGAKRLEDMSLAAGEKQMRQFDRLVYDARYRESDAIGKRAGGMGPGARAGMGYG